MKTSNHLLRRLTAALLAAVLALSIALPVFASDDGDTIYINSVSDLLSLARNCAYDQWSVGKTVILQKDLSLEGMLWEPIPSFSGQFKGNGHIISDLTITGQYSPAGLFGIVEEQGSIESLSVRGVVSVSDSADTTTGGIVGINHGTLINCQFTGVVTGDSEVGGIVGRNESEGTIDHGTARAIVTGKSSTGGIAGYNLGAITGCTNVGSINTEYPEASLDTDGFTAKMVDYINNKMAAADNDATNSVTNVATDTGGIAGRSSGMILTSVNTGTIGYEHVGYNVGGIVGRTDGLVSGCVNQGRVLGRKDVGGIAGQAEPYRELDLSKDTIKRLRSELEVLRGLVDDTTGVVENSTTSISNSFSAMTSQMDTAIAAARQLDDQASDYGDEVADEIDRASTLLADTLTKLEPVMDTGEDAMTKLTDATGNLKWAMREMAAEMLMASSALAKTSKGLDKVSDAAEDGRDGMSAISEGIKQLLESVDTGDDSAASQAISTILTGYDSLSSDKKSDKNLKTGIELLKVANSVASVFTLGSGMAPAMKAVTAGMGLLRTSYTVSAVLIGNINEGSITAKKDMVGGIVGQEELGLVTACESYGDITGVNQVGGIAGAASAKLRSNWAKCALSGEKYIGGIVGQGTDSDLTDGSLIAINNRAIVSVLEGQQYVGAVSGGQDGGFYGNLFVSDELQGIDRLSRVGQAEPVTYETLLAQENVPDSFRKLTLTFKADGHIIKKISFDYGASFTLDDYPEIPQKNGYYAEWSTPVLDQLHTDTVVNVEYTPYIPSLSSSVTRENGRPVFFVDGFFGGSNAVQVTQQDITADVHGVTEQWLLEFTDDGNETHQIRYLTPGKAKGKVYVKQADGSWHKVETGSFGSYTTFTTTGTEVEVAFVPAKLPVWAFCAGGAALLVLLLLLAKRIKSKHGPKGEKPRREKKGKQPETADAPADELDTPISETDMQ